jgi:peroxiredoxin
MMVPQPKNFFSRLLEVSMRAGPFRVLLVLVLVQTVAPAQRSHLLLEVGPTVTGAPFSATRTLDYEPAENSSDPAAVHAEAKVFRDSAGRMRWEIRNPGHLPLVDILDCVAHIHYRWSVGETTVMRYPLQNTTPAATSPAAETLDPDAPQVEGMPTRRSHRVVGTNSVEETYDTWYAPSLHLAMVTIVDQPGVGKTTYRFVGATLAEPDPALFRVPTGMTVEDTNQAPPPPPVARNPTTAEPAPTGAPAPAYASDPKFQQALASAKEMRMPVDERLARWKNANKIAKGQCIECLHQMIQLQIVQKQWKDVYNTCNQLDAIATTPKEKFYAESERGAALMHGNNDEPKPDQVKAAEDSLRAALTITPSSANLVYLDGRALAMMGRDDEAKAMFQKYLDLVGMSDPYRTRAEHFIEDPRLAALRMAPAFTLTTSEGEQMSLDEMGGKVVLLDFWATWCGPCNQALPEIRRIAQKFADQPFVVISISSDTNEAAWSTFIRTNRMTWPQYRDANGALNRAYGVSSIPRYFTIDTDGALQSVKVGSGADVEGDVKKLLNKAHDAEKKKARESDRAAATQ